MIWQLLKAGCDFAPLCAMIVVAFWVRDHLRRSAREVKDLRVEVDRLGHACRQLSQLRGHEDEVSVRREEGVARDSRCDDVPMAPLPAVRIVRNMLNRASARTESRV